jgi:hypothetical protein
LWWSGGQGKAKQGRAGWGEIGDPPIIGATSSTSHPLHIHSCDHPPPPPQTAHSPDSRLRQHAFTFTPLAVYTPPTRALIERIINTDPSFGCCRQFDVTLPYRNNISHYKSLLPSLWDVPFEHRQMSPHASTRSGFGINV